MRRLLAVFASLPFIAAAAADPAASSTNAAPGVKPASSTAATPAKGAEVYIISPRDGATVSSPVTVRFGLKGMGIAPAGVQADNTGHHHLLVDMDAPADLSQPMPMNEHVLHFGKGQTEAEVKLSPGHHTLQLIFADYRHVPVNPPLMSKKISITVKGSRQSQQGKT